MGDTRYCANARLQQMIMRTLLPFFSVVHRNRYVAWFVVCRESVVPVPMTLTRFFRRSPCQLDYYSIRPYFISSPLASYCLRLPTGGSLSILSSPPSAAHPSCLSLTMQIYDIAKGPTVHKDAQGENNVINHR